MVTGDLIADEIGLVILLFCIWPIIWVGIEKGFIWYKDEYDDEEWEDDE